jgi:hypothetical protein
MALERAKALARVKRRLAALLSFTLTACAKRPAATAVPTCGQIGNQKSSLCRYGKKSEAWYGQPVKRHPNRLANRLGLCKQKASRTVEQMQIDFRNKLYELRPIQLHPGAAVWAGRRFNVIQRVLKSVHHNPPQASDESPEPQKPPFSRRADMSSGAWFRAFYGRYSARVVT